MASSSSEASPAAWPMEAKRAPDIWKAGIMPAAAGSSEGWWMRVPVEATLDASVAAVRARAVSRLALSKTRRSVTRMALAPGARSA